MNPLIKYINVYDKDHHPHEDCERIKQEWLKQVCNAKVKTIEHNEKCYKLFREYYDCHFQYLTPPPTSSTK